MTVSAVQILFGTATLTAAAGLWLLLPRGNTAGRPAGIVLGLVSLGLFVAGSQIPSLGSWWTTGIFAAIAATTVVSAVASMTLRNPVYCAVWFALTLLGTAGLLLLQGAQFLGIATVVVYAGAIVVTFLFVLMLANPRGHAYYDRVSWEAMLSASTGAVIVGILTLAMTTAIHAPESDRITDTVDAETRAAEVLHEQHVAHLGMHLFSEYLIAVEVAGALLLMALAGAVAIVVQSQDQQSHSPHPVSQGVGE